MTAGCRFALLALAVAASGCLHVDGESDRYAGLRTALAQNQQRWQVSGIVSYETVPGLFENIRSAIEYGAETVHAEYDPGMYYPTFVFTDHISGAVDDEIQFNARDLTAI